MKLGKAQAQWVDDLIMQSTKQEEEALKSKREQLRQLGVTFSQLRTAEEAAAQAAQNYIKMTGASKKTVIKILHATPAEQHILFDPQESYQCLVERHES